VLKSISGLQLRFVKCCNDGCLFMHVPHVISGTMHVLIRLDYERDGETPAIRDLSRDSSNLAISGGLACCDLPVAGWP